MHRHYADLLDGRDPPQWWQDEGVPRFCAFAPGQVSDIYCDEAALVAITCQGCGTPFKVAFTSGSMDQVRALMADRPFRSLADLIRERALHYGDPPNAECCAAGPTMNSEPRRVLEYWRRHDQAHVGPGGTVTDVAAYMEWHRDPTLEVSIEPEWVLEDDQHGAADAESDAAVTP